MSTEQGHDPVTAAMSSGLDATVDERARAVTGQFVARFGAPTLAHYRHVYDRLGLDWPGEDAIRAEHPVAPDTTSAA